MASEADPTVAVGRRVRVRGDRWTVVSTTPHLDCRSVRLSGCGASNQGTIRTLLLPFDRMQPVDSTPRLRVVGRRRWAHHVRHALLSAHPFGGLRAAATATFDLLPFQLEPALAMLRHARLRILIADEVGLGKTIQSGIILNELSAADAAFRGLVVTPAGVREQWQRELEARFSLPTTLADAAWLAAAARNLPADVNPWSMPGTYVTSLDLVKRPEVLRALEDVTWDLTVVDEVHGAGVGTARLAAANAIGARSRRIVLLTATPPDSEPAHLLAIAGIGATPGAPPITELRRTRGIAGIAARRKSVLLGVRLSRAERRMHRLLERYTSLVWQEAGARHDTRARLAAVILRKRALSSAGSLALSVRRRLALLGTPPEAYGHQLLLPLCDEEPLDDHPRDDIIGTTGLSDIGLERACLEEIAAAAESASLDESKLRFLRRLLARARQPAVVFTEYRDTLAQIAAGMPAPVPLLLHGDMTPVERSVAQRRFNSSGALLLATDAASEGLNLHGRCRLVIHFELPWTPMRLEQRTGRVDRLGQSRTVHEVLLMARDTAERLVLAPLLKRARVAAARSGRPPAAISESTVANALMDGVAVRPVETATHRPTTPINLRAEAEEESRRLSFHRRLDASRRAPVTSERDISITTGRLRSAPDALAAVSVTVSDAGGQVVHSELIAVAFPAQSTSSRQKARDVVQWASALLERCANDAAARVARHRSSACEEAVQLFRAHADALALRERAMVAGLPSAARTLVQAGLFDRRAVDHASRRQTVAELLSSDAASRVVALQADAPPRTSIRIVALHAGWRPR